MQQTASVIERRTLRQPRRWVWAIWAVLPILAGAMISVIGGDQTVVAEGGHIESMQVGLLVVTAVVAFLFAQRIKNRQSSSMTCLLGVFALLAMARELDLHVWLNPEKLGDWGVRYRIDWWLDGQVPIKIKLVWLAVFATVGGVLGWLMVRLRGPVSWRSTRARLLIFTVFFYFVGFTCDDLLRHRVDLRVAQWIEEIAELFAAAALLGATLEPEVWVETITPSNRRV